MRMDPRGFPVSGVPSLSCCNVPPTRSSFFSKIGVQIPPFEHYGGASKVLFLEGVFHFQVFVRRHISPPDLDVHILGLRAVFETKINFHCYYLDTKWNMHTVAL